MSLQRVFDPGSVAVVGASKVETKRGFQTLKSLIEEPFDGVVYPVNPRESTILGRRVYPSVADIEGPVDLAFITTPAATVPAVLEDCGRKGVAGAVVIAGGFGELGATGKEQERHLVEVAKAQGVRIVGPNTSGMINVWRKLDLLGLGHVPKGDIALLTQSGNMALSLITEASVKSQRGFSYYIGVGNEADIRFHEYLRFLEDDPRTKVILMYVEGMREGRAFLQQAYQTTRKKPVVLLKGGRSATGRRSAGSHTGALAGISEVARTAFRRAGIVVVESSDELFAAAEALSALPYLRGDGVAILADGGGHATIAADVLSELRVAIPELTEKSQEKLREILPAAASVRNPVDVAGGADANPVVLADCARILVHDPHVAAVLVVGLFGGYALRFAKGLEFVEEDAAHQMGKLVRDSKKPIIVHSLYSFAKPHALDLLRYYGIPVHDSLEVACKCVGVLAEHGHYIRSYQAKAKFVFDRRVRAEPRGEEIIAKVRAEGRRSLLEPEAKELLLLHGCECLEERVATSAAEAVDAAASLGGKVALKVVSPQISHKSDAGGVALDVEGSDAVARTYEEILRNIRRYDASADVRGVLVCQMARPGVEVIVGTKMDEQFGPVIMFGIGGIFVEVLKDVVFRVLPISPWSARKMVEEIKAVRLLEGFRGQPPVDKKAIARLLSTVSDIIEAYPAIEEMDLNPVVVDEEGLTVVDARIILEE